MLPLRSFTSVPSRFSAFSMLVGEGGIDVAYDEAYGSHPRQRLDVYRARDDDGVGPVALFLYGGSWKGGCKSCYGFVGAALAAQGIPTAVADYRVYPEVRWPAFQEDAAAAHAWVRAALADRGGRRVVVIGHSAGAHMAALLATDPRWHGAMPPAGLVGLSGPYAFQPTEWPTTREIFATARHCDEPRPIAHAGRHVPPTLLIHGAADDKVKPHNTTEFAAALSASGVSVEVRLIDGIGHTGTITAFARPLRWRAPALDLTVRFVQGLARRQAQPAGQVGERDPTRQARI